MLLTPQATVEELFRRAASGERPEHIAELVSEAVDWYVAGDVEAVPWIGRKQGRAGAADFYRQIQERIISEKFVVSDILAKDSRVIALGDLESRVRATGKLIRSEFAFDFTVEDGQITRFRLFEDSHAVAQAVA